MSEKNIHAVGLDVGTSRIVSARPAEDGFTYATQLNAFVDLPWSKLTINTLRKESIPHSVEDGHIVVYGSESGRFADLLGVEMRRSMIRGLLNAAEPDSLTQMRRLLEYLIGGATTKHQRVCFSVPAPLPGAEESLRYHEASLRQVLGEMGYEARSINEGLAVVYGEMEASNYTGIGISFGAGLCNVCLAYLSVPLVTFSLPKAGDYIDSSAASAIGELTNRIRLRKEDTFHFNGTFSDKSLQALSVYYEEMIAAVIEQMGAAFAPCSRTGRFKTPVPVVLSGGSSMPKGFADRFEAALRRTKFPLPIAEVRASAAPLETTAKGALIAALSDFD